MVSYIVLIMCVMQCVATLFYVMLWYCMLRVVMLGYVMLRHAMVCYVIYPFIYTHILGCIYI